MKKKKQTFPTPTRPVTRESPASFSRSGSRGPMTPKDGKRPNTQGTSRGLLSREHTITEERDDDRRHLYTAMSNSAKSPLPMDSDDMGPSQRLSVPYPLRRLSGVTEEDRSHRAMECSFCKGTFTEPKVFCCTRLCKKCLQSHIDISELDTEVSCLVCRSSVQIPDKTQPRESWAEQFRTDQFLQRLQDIAIQLKEKHECYVCRTSKNKKTNSSTYCFDCDTYYCEACNVMHLQLRGLMSHSTAELSALKPADIMSRRRVYCEKHTDRYIERYCKQCQALLCQLCVDQKHKKCTVIPTNQVADEKRRVLEGLKQDFDAALRRAEEEDEMLRDRGSRMQNRVSQRKEEIETAFGRIEKAVAERKKRLLEELADDGLLGGRGNENKIGQLQTLMGALKDNGALADEMLGCGSDRDIIESTDDLVRQCSTLGEVTHNTTRLALDQPVNMARVDKYSVNTFLTLLAALGEDISVQVVAFKTRQIGLRISEDKEQPSIKDIVLLDNNTLLAVDNANKRLKAIMPREEGGYKFHSLNFKTRPWGVCVMQPNVVAVSGHQCLYIVTVTEEALGLQTTVRTRKDYWSIVALSPINLACICKFPPSIDIIDITGRRLRTIDGENNGECIFKQPSFISYMDGNILVTDRHERTLICLDQGGDVKFIHRTTKDEESNPLGVCSDPQNRAFLVDGPDVYMVSAEGKQVCQVLTGLPDPRSISIGKNNTMAVSIDSRAVTFFTLAELKGPY